ncbi:MAG: ABC-F family ATP-binding cassette domain-containing protein [Planctomycetota bacterium]
MALVSLSHVDKGYGGEPLFRDVTLEVERGRKIGVIGKNGGGKSTLLRLIAGRLEPDAGDVFRQRDAVVAFQTQELEADADATVIQEMRRLFGDAIHLETRLRDLEAELGRPHPAEEQERLLKEYARLQELHESKGGWTVERRIETVLTGLGLAPSSWEMPISSFSGGERNVIALARALLSEPDLLLLDEPSNHLDIDGLEWFVRFLRSTPMTVVMVSHDRHLLDAAIDEIWEVRSGRVTSWTGNYSDYEQRRGEAQALQERQFKNQQRLIKRLEFQARRLRDMAQAYDDPGQAKRAKSILKRIEAMDKVEKPEGEEAVFRARLKGGRRHGQLALRLEDYAFSYGDRVIFEPSSLEIEFGQRVALVGPNGCGKSTLFRSIVSEGSWENPRIRLGKAVRLGDYNQFHEDALDPRQSLIGWLLGVTGLDYQPGTELLHRFLFTRDDLDREIGSLSGGEKSRLQLARLVHHQVNFLLLDEPTNHLDIASAEQLETMLDEFEGTLFVISHDRYFLEKIVDVVVEVRDRHLVAFRGGFSAWWAAREARRQGESGRGGLLRLQSQAAARDRAEAEPEAARGAAREDREARKERQREARRLRRRVDELEAAIEAGETRVAELETRIAEHWSGNGDPARGRALGEELEAEGTAVAAAYAEWEELAPRLESLGESD